MLSRSVKNEFKQDIELDCSSTSAWICTLIEQNILTDLKVYGKEWFYETNKDGYRHITKRVYNFIEKWMNKKYNATYYTNKYRRI